MCLICIVSSVEASRFQNIPGLNFKAKAKLEIARHLYCKKNWTGTNWIGNNWTGKGFHFLNQENPAAEDLFFFSNMHRLSQSYIICIRSYKDPRVYTLSPVLSPPFLLEIFNLFIFFVNKRPRFLQELSSVKLIAPQAAQAQYSKKLCTRNSILSGNLWMRAVFVSEFDNLKWGSPFLLLQTNETLCFLVVTAAL